MLAKIVLTMGHPDERSSLELDTNTAPLTIFVGPNNSGKSLALREIAASISSGNFTRKLINNVQFSTIPEDEIDERIAEIAVPSKLPDDHILIGKGENPDSLRRTDLLESMRNPNERHMQFCASYARHNYIQLNGRSRFSILNNMPLGDLKAPPTHRLRVLYDDTEKRRKLRKLTHDAFGLCFVLDPTDSGTLTVRFSNTYPEEEEIEHSLTKRAIEFHGNALTCSEVSDGVVAFTAILTEIIAGNPRVILIDEPEAFLHPSLANQLGKIVSCLGRDARKQVFVSTHSPYFLMGCLQSGVRTNIVRLTYRNQHAKARTIEADTLSAILNDPLLRSTGMLEGLFFEYVVVTEGDSDRAFYQEINERLLGTEEGRGLPGCLFVNARGKQSIWKIIQLLRKLGIPAAAIVDMDIIKCEGTEWSNFMRALNVPDSVSQALGQARGNVKRSFEGLDNKNAMKTIGIQALVKEDESSSARWLLERLEAFGAFTVPNGELESWLPTLYCTGNKSNWVCEIFQKMGSEPSSTEYQHPANDDVWAFMDRVAKWCQDESRSGVPD